MAHYAKFLSFGTCAGYNFHQFSIQMEARQTHRERERGEARTTVRRPHDIVLSKFVNTFAKDLSIAEKGCDCSICINKAIVASGPVEGVCNMCVTMCVCVCVNRCAKVWRRRMRTCASLIILVLVLAPGWKLKQVDAISANGLIGVAGADPDPAGGG